jgi:hypothetical protein
LCEEQLQVREPLGKLRYDNAKAALVGGAGDWEGCAMVFRKRPLFARERATPRRQHQQHRQDAIRDDWSGLYSW